MLWQGAPGAPVGHKQLRHWHQVPIDKAVVFVGLVGLLSRGLQNLGFFFFFFLFLTWSLTCGPGWRAVAQSQLTATSICQVSVILLPSPPE